MMYKDWECPGCHSYVNEFQLTDDGRCPNCGRDLFWETVEEYVDDPEDEKDVSYGIDGGS